MLLHFLLPFAFLAAQAVSADTTTPSATPSPTPTPTPTLPAASLPCPGSLTGQAWSSIGQAGDFAVTLAPDGYVLGFNRQTHAWYMISTSLAGHYLSGVSVPPTEPTRLSILDRTAKKAMLLSADGTTATAFATFDSAVPYVMAWHPTDGSLWVSDLENNNLWRAPAGGGAATLAASFGGGWPDPLAFLPDGTLLIGMNASSEVYAISQTGSWPAISAPQLLTSGLNQTRSFAWDGKTTLYSASFNSTTNAPTWLYSVDLTSPAPVFLTSTFSPLTQNASNSYELYTPGEMAIDDLGYLWIAMARNGVAGLLKLEPGTGKPLEFYQLPSTVDGYMMNSDPSLTGLVEMGMTLPRASCLTASSTPTTTATAESTTQTPTYTSTPTCTSTQTCTYCSTSTCTASPSPTATPTQVNATPTASPSITHSPYPSPSTNNGGGAPWTEGKTVRVCGGLVHPGQARVLIQAKLPPGHCSVVVYKCNLKVATLYDGDTDNLGNLDIPWNLKNRAGTRVSSGIYQIVITDTKGKNHIGKIMVVR